MKTRVRYYSDELNDDFAGAQLTSDKLENYKYNHGKIWRLIGGFLYRFIAIPICSLYDYIIYRERIKNRKVMRKYKKEGFFVYGNHTMSASDAFTPSMVTFPKKPYIIVGTATMKYKFLGVLVDMMGGVPIPSDFKGMKDFTAHIYDLAKRKKVIYIYPEAHIWPYYTGIRSFKDVSFDYPVKTNKPVFAVTKTFHKRRIGRLPRVITYIDGPFFPDESLPKNKQRAKLRDEVYAAMVERSKLSDYNYIEYVNRESIINRDPIGAFCAEDEKIAVSE